jgi:hypothetical protein
MPALGLSLTLRPHELRLWLLPYFLQNPHLTPLEHNKPTKVYVESSTRRYAVKWEKENAFC